MGGIFVALTITVKGDSQKAVRKLKDQILHRSPRAAAAGINRTAQAARTEAIRAVQVDAGTSSQKSIRRNIRVTKATHVTEHLTAKVEARSTKQHRIPIFEMGPKPRAVTRRRPAGGVRYGPRQKLLAGSFIARMKSGGVFKRLGQGRTPIAELFGPSVALVLARKRVYEKVRKVIAERLPREIQRAFRFAR